MSTQHKPTGKYKTHHNICPKDERCACYLTGYTDAEYDQGLAVDTLGDQPKPTGEWTARKAPTGYIAALYCGNTEIYRQSLDCLADLERVADAHNAALAAERETSKRWQEVHDLALRREQQLRDQLASERERADKNANVIEATALELHDVRQQLAAEREHARKLLDGAISDNLRRLAAVEKSGRNTGWNEGREHERKCAAAMRAKVKEAK